MTGTRLGAVISLLLAVFVILYGGLSCLIPLCGVTVPGEITQVQKDYSAKGDKVQVSFSFQTEKGGERSGGYTMDKEPFPKEGDSIRVTYLPFAPMVCNVEGMQLISPTISASLLGLGVLLLLFSIFSLRRARRRES